MLSAISSLPTSLAGMIDTSEFSLETIRNVMSEMEGKVKKGEFAQVISPTL